VPHLDPLHLRDTSGPPMWPPGAIDKTMS
jgi:hypothetical protein